VSTKTSRPGKPNTGNRFDSPTGAYGVRYFASDLDGCYGETLARFRADKKLAKVIGTEWSELGFMNVGDEDERPMYAGVRYLSRLNSDWELWAVFDNVAIEEMTRRAILPNDEALQRVAKTYGLTVY
jgi:hypothetical protein